MRVEKTKTWKDNWNDILRYKIFQDEALKQLMLIPDGTGILHFVDKYFLENLTGDEILTDEKVRVVYYDSDGGDSDNKDVKLRYKEFDIFVREDVLHNADPKDMLRNRYDMIAERLRFLLTGETYLYGMRFSYKNAYNLWTKTIGYRRCHVVFTYYITV